ncbi:MAG: hypothetical protein WDO24_12880 [Pseudomonadota bacterium]
MGRWRRALRARAGRLPQRASLQVKLVIAFLLVSLVPMLVAAQLTARVVSAVFEKNMEIWLTETSSFLLNEIVSSQREATGLARFVVDHTSMASQLATGTGELQPSVAALLDVLGYDLVTIYSPERGILYATQPIKNLQRLPLGTESRLYRVDFGDHSAVMVAGVASFTVGGTPYSLIVGNWLDDKFMSNLAAMSSLEARLYYRDAGEFVEIYSAQPSAPPNRALPAMVRDRLESGPALFYDPHAIGGGLSRDLSRGAGRRARADGDHLLRLARRSHGRRLARREEPVRDHLRDRSGPVGGGGRAGGAAPDPAAALARRRRPGDRGRRLRPARRGAGQ